MKLCLTSNISFYAIEHLVDINLLTTALIVVHRTKWPDAIHLDLGASLMVTTESHLSNWVKFLASVTFQ